VSRRLPPLDLASFPVSVSQAGTRVEDWFVTRGWRPFAYQRAVWDAYAAGDSGLLHAATGTGKTFAVWLAVLQEAMTRPRAPARTLRALWITPLRALAVDIAVALRAPAHDMNIGWTVETRTGDTSASLRARQKKGLPEALVTTPESLTLLLTQPDARDRFVALNAVVVDEWHELIGGKRGVQMELALARLRTWKPDIKVWGLSATIGNTTQAMDVLLAGQRGRLIEGERVKATAVQTVIPASVQRFPWAGHLGLTLIDPVLRAIENARSTLLFTNTRSQAELWFQALQALRPEWEPLIRLHHGSLDPAERDAVEAGLRAGSLKAVVATSSLDLGVDFSPVDQVIQVGSPKGVARLLQRAGRSGHQPGAPSAVLCVPTNAFELVEFAAAARAIQRGELESRMPLRWPLDVLVQHLVTVALGGGFEEATLKAEVLATHAFRDLPDLEWQWALAFVTTGGVLHHYPDYRRVVQRDGRFTVEDKGIAYRHRMSVGTITSDAAVEVKLTRGRRLGTVEESFIAKLRKGDHFLFAGRKLQLVRVHDMVAQVRLATGQSAAVPRWLGGRLPFSTELQRGVRRLLADASQARFEGPEMTALRPILDLQARLSRVPREDELVVERVRSREGRHLFFYPFAGRAANEGLAAIVSYRLSLRQPATFTLSATDYGFELLTRAALNVTEADLRAALSTEHLFDDIRACLNATEMARRQFREIARVAGLVFQGTPWQAKTARQIQASSGLIYDVFRQYDPANRLLAQADTEVLERQLDMHRLSETLREIESQTIVMIEPPRFTPLAFPLWAERAQHAVSSETWRERVEKMALALERASGPMNG